MITCFGKDFFQLKLLRLRKLAMVRDLKEDKGVELDKEEVSLAIRLPLLKIQF